MRMLISKYEFEFIHQLTIVPKQTSLRIVLTITKHTSGHIVKI